MRSIIFLLFAFLLAACETQTLRVQPADEWQTTATADQITVQTFREVSRAVGSEARSECRRRASNRNCDFRILVDLNPRAPANAFQTLDDNDQPVII
ncbi:MAG: peptidase M48, partial [Pseudomonadota bacterium]